MEFVVLKILVKEEKMTKPELILGPIVGGLPDTSMCIFNEVRHK